MSSAMGMTPEELAHTITEAQHINAAKYYLIASITMMAYDMVLTFHLEVSYEYIWKRKKTLVSYLFLVNRYLNPYYIITTTAYFDPSWTFAPHFSANLDFTDIIYALKTWVFVALMGRLILGAATCATYAITNLMMTLRVHALWQNKWVLGYLLSLCVIQVAMWGYVLNYSEREYRTQCDLSSAHESSASRLIPEHRRDIPCLMAVGCILTGKPSFAKGRIFSVIFTVNVVWLVMTFHATETLKNINEHFGYDEVWVQGRDADLYHRVSVVLISRLTIHLRSEGDRHSKEIWRPGPPVPSARGRHHSNSFSSPPDQTGSVSTYAGQRWSRSEKGKNKSIDGVGSPPESVSTHIGPSPGSTVADLNKDLEKMGESSRIWRRGSLLRRDSVAFEGERQRERPPSWMNRMRTVSRRESGALPPSSTEMEPYVRSFPQTMASWDSTREAGPSPIEAAALSIRRSEDDVFAFSMPERPPVARLHGYQEHVGFSGRRDLLQMEFTALRACHSELYHHRRHLPQGSPASSVLSTVSNGLKMGLTPGHL
ncbi:hypothetical protein AG1IA_03581 [Rhizoctonia solani AG-1 IA]|uniref:DUF6533 domain-containing protein n=1 Tax=Thanatephorus cucumeris (strain AG1-IA) TaxID=983506 RepID=L8X001_THACA|nr:hypothetical protein AG1IA_03581 [Rhizoctonia solani AG-1 IA]